VEIALSGIRLYTNTLPVYALLNQQWKKSAQGQMDKIVVSASEIGEIKDEILAETPAPPQPKLQPAVPWWAKLALAPFVLLLPVLCLFTIILRVALRSQPPRVTHAWTAYLSTLLIISGFLTSAIAVVTFSLSPIPAIVSSGLAELDERTEYPALPAKSALSGADAAIQLKSLVAVISPAAKSLFGKREVLSNEFGAGMLLQANSSGFLFGTARHVIGTGNWDLRKDVPRALVSMSSGVWAGADVIARHTTLDLVLVWLPRHSGQADFVQPITTANEGESIIVIGHPEGLKFTMSTGIVSRMEYSVLQISAPVSPGNSGGPVYDQQGNLVGVVNSTMDKSIRPNAENLNFAVSAQALLREAGWEFVQGGRERWEQFARASSASSKHKEQSRYNAVPRSGLATGLLTNGHN
jgi:S1-C subfamily serine protease